MGFAPRLRAAFAVGSRYGAKPHESAAKRRAGYPHGQAQLVQILYGWRTTGPLPVEAAGSWQRALRADDAASRPDNRQFKTSAAPFFTRRGKIFN
jgi:hypothetical protein